MTRQSTAAEINAGAAPPTILAIPKDTVLARLAALEQFPI